MAETREVEYHCKDFSWDDLKATVENDPSLHYHLTPLPTATAPPPPAAADAWRSFHRRHSSGKFFKERRYLLKEFPELVSCDDSAKVLEVGCGNGSTVLPILRFLPEVWIAGEPVPRRAFCSSKQSTVVYACDCSEEILERAKGMISTANVTSSEQRFHPFLHDFSVSEFPNWLFCANCRRTSSSKKLNFLSDAKESVTKSSYLSHLEGPQCCIGGVDFVTLIFTLSAVPSQKMTFVIQECFSVLKPGCLLLFRDYGIYDMTMLRLPSDQRVGFREYMRLDGTLSFFFSLDIVRDLFLGAGFIELELEYCCVTSVNRRNGKTMQRVWVHGKFQKPI